MANNNTVPFTEKDVKVYLDRAISFWRRKRDEGGIPHANYYIDAYQSVRISLFGETLPADMSVCDCGNPKSVDAVCCAECTTEKKEQFGLINY